jgi:uracil-DNA glycosylase
MATRQQRKAALDAQIKACRRCKGMNRPNETEAAPGFGSVRSPVVIVGQSLCRPCMKTQIPFTGGSGKLIDASLKIAGIAKDEVFITNLVHCHPPRNHKSLPIWIENCSSYLHRELEIVHPRLVIGMGRDAEAALRSFYTEPRVLTWPFTVPRATRSKTVPYLLFAKHPSWIKRQHDDSLEEEYRTSLARALKWGFRNAPADRKRRTGR